MPIVRLVEEPVPGSTYTLLGPSNPNMAKHLSIEQRAAMARRIIELDGKLPRYHGGKAHAQSPETDV